MTHNGLVDAILLDAGRLGIVGHYCPDSRRCRGQAGLPDLILAGRRGILFAEVKTGSGDTTAAQDLWIWYLHESGHVVHIWTERAYADGIVQRQLENIA